MLKQLLLGCLGLLWIAGSPIGHDGRLKYKSETYSVSVPKGWWIDPFSSSSVCDCPGLIAGVDDAQPKYVVYPADAAGMAEEMRNAVWDYVWDDQGAAPYAYTNGDGVVFKGWKGQWKEAADGHAVIKLDANKGKDHVRIFIFGPSEAMELADDMHRKFLEWFAWR